MSEMIERVARAIWEVRREKAALVSIELEEWGDGSIPRANHLMEEAKAAIEAMQEPTIEMVVAAYSIVGIPREPVLANWYRAMIDAALLTANSTGK